MPKEFKLRSETPKFDGRQEPSSWLEDYKIAVSCQRGTTTTAMQYIQLMLVGSARDWLKSKPRNAYDSWDDFTEDFVKNFAATCEWPATYEKLRACRQRSDESLRSYIRRWTTIRNSAGTVSEDRAIDTFTQGLARRDFQEALGREKPKSIAQLMKVANEWADGEDSVRDKHESPRRDSSWSHKDGHGNDRRKKRKTHHYDDADGADLVAAGYVDALDERARSGSRQDDRSGSRHDDRTATMDSAARDTASGSGENPMTTRKMSAQSRQK